MPVLAETKARIAKHSEDLDRLRRELAKGIVGQTAMLDRLLIALLSGGHILLEGVPGIAKTTAIKSLAQAIAVDFKRIQFTPDLLPADLVGTMIFNPGTSSFSARKGPIFANFVLADEVNRAPSKVQSALLEAMQERQVTIGDATYTLPSPFLVLATQNPIEQEGTYPLPEAQVDRFMLKVKITYPEPKDEREVVNRALDGEIGAIQPVLTQKDVEAMQAAVRQVYVDDNIRDYLLEIVLATRKPADVGLKRLVPLIEYGGSPRASIFLATAARAHAFLDGRAYVTPQDVKDVAYDILRHRVLMTYEADAEQVTSDDVVREILGKVRVP